jgi:thymidylate kinase
MKGRGRGWGPDGRRGMTIVLLGPDGAGKTTLARGLVARPDLGARRFYMGTNPRAREATFPRWQSSRIRSDAPAGEGAPGPGPRRLTFPRRLVGQWYRYAFAHLHRMRGGTVVFDRYILAPRILRSPRSRGESFRRWLLRLGAPRPDLVVILDAPAETLFRRKGEHDVQRLAEMRRDYLRLGRTLPGAVVVDAGADPDSVLAGVVGLIHQRKSGGRDASVWRRPWVTRA